MQCTLFHKLKFGIDKAFEMLYGITTSKRGANSIWLAEHFGINQKTAWLFRQKVLANDFQNIDVIISAASNCRHLIKNIPISSQKVLLIDLALPSNIDSALRSKESKHFIEGKLTNFENEPIEEAELKVQLQRLFSPLPIGKGIYFTDENGEVEVPIINKMPGVDGKLNYEVILEDSDEYGTIKSILRTKIGKPIEDLSTFDERTMWSPPGKTPKFFLIYPNLIILGIWTFIIILTINLYRISKHKNS